MKKLAIVAALLATTAAQAQVYNQDFMTFEGVMFVLDNPTLPACQAQAVNYGSAYRFTYRFVANPVGGITEALSFFYDSHAGPVARRYAPLRGSLNGAVSGFWDYFGVYGGSGSDIPGTSTLTILSGISTPVQIGVTGTMKFSGTFGDFLNFPGCNVTVHGAGAAKPN